MLGLGMVDRKRTALCIPEIWQTLGIFALLFTQYTTASGTYPIDTFDIPEGAYSASFIADENSITVMSFSGDYDKTLESGQLNRAARAAVAKEFYRTHPDNYDFLVTFTSFEFDTGEATAFYHGVKNNVQGIGVPIFDNSATYSSQGKLQGFIDMAALSRYNLNSFDAEFDLPLSVLAHEVLHRWGVFVQFNDAEGNPSNALLGRDSAHWSFFLDSDASIQYGSQWKNNQDGTFTATGTRRFYSPLDLYLMGFKNASEVNDFILINPVDSTFTASSLPVQGATVTGTTTSISVTDIIAAEGARIPSADDAQKEFRFGFIYLVGGDEDIDEAKIVQIDALRRAFIERFSIMTGGRGIAHVYPEALPVADLGEQVGVQAASDDVFRVDTADVEDAISWLKAQQTAAEGYWADTSNTRVRDTSVVLSTLRDLDASFAGGAAPAIWLNSLVSQNTDSLARTILALGSAATDQIAELESRQADDGGWALLPDYKSSALDTALAIRALSHTEVAPSGINTRIGSGVNFLLSQQNADFGWPESLGGGSSLHATNAAIYALVDAEGASGAVENAISWLSIQQNSDGGFGKPVSTVHETAEVILTVVKAKLDAEIDTSSAIAFIRDRQRESGNWEGSVYTTAVAASALRSISRQNLAVISFNADEDNRRDGERVNLTVMVTNDSPLNTEVASLQIFEGDPNNGGASVLGPVNIPILNPGNTLSFNFFWDTFEKAGSQKLYAVIDQEAALLERSKGDNVISLVYAVEAATEGVDLELSLNDILITPENPVEIPSQLSVSAIVRNTGVNDANNVIAQVWRGEPENGGTLTDEIIINVPGRSSTSANFFTDLIFPGDTAFVVVVDPDGVIPESREDNNQIKRIITTAPSLDLEVMAADISYSPSPALLYEDVTITAVIRNKGTLTTPNTNVVVGINNENGFQEVENTELVLAAGEERTLKLQWKANLIGESTLSIAIDESNLIAEADDANNSASISVITEQFEGSNLSVRADGLNVNPNPANEGFGATLSAEVFNTGTVPLTGISVAFFDNDPNAGGLQISNTVVVASLAPGESTTVNQIWSKIPDAKNHFIFVIVDYDGEFNEFSESDNLAFIELPVNSLPDLAVSESAIQLSPAFPALGDTATVTVNINNHGSQDVADLLVRAYRGGAPDNGGIEIGSGFTVPSIASMGAGQIIFDMQFDSQGVEEIFVIVDPQQTIKEAVRTNNSALKSVAIQNNDYYVSERYISPNGDGIKEQSNYFFRLGEPDTVEVVVIDAGEREVRHFEKTFSNASSGNVIWDGRSDAGALVNDGDYRIVVKTSNGGYTGAVRVVVDTNRSGLVEALGTQYAFTTDLSCRVGGVLGAPSTDGDQELIGDRGIAWGPDEEYIYFITHYAVREIDGVVVNTSDHVLHPTGLYRADKYGTNIVQLSDLGGARVIASKIIVSPDSSHLVVITPDGRVLSMDLKSGSDLELVAEIGEGLEFRDAVFVGKTNDLAIVSQAYVAVDDLFVQAINLLDSEPQLRDITTYSIGYLIDRALTSNLNYIPIKLKSNLTGTALSLHVAGQFNYYTRADEVLANIATLVLVDTQSGKATLISDYAHDYQWSPEGGRILVADPAKGGVFVYSSTGEIVQSNFFRESNFLVGSDELQAIVPEAFRRDRSILGYFHGVAWNPDGLEFAFVFQELSGAVVLEAVLRAEGRELDCPDGAAEGYGCDVYGPVDLYSPEKYNIPDGDLSGVYVVDTRSGQREKHADVAPYNHYPSVYYGWVEQYFEELDFIGQEPIGWYSFGDYVEHVPSKVIDLPTDRYGTKISKNGLPLLPPVVVDEGWQIHFAERSVEWFSGARALQVGASHSRLDDPYIVGLDASIPTRVNPLTKLDPLGVLARPTPSGKLFLSYQYSSQSLCSKVYDGHFLSTESLLNLKADLRTIRSSESGGILLEGTATDKNFESWVLEYALTSEPDGWFSIAPLASNMVVDESLTTWVPPAAGSYLVRLSVTDLAGNKRQSIARTSTSDSPSVTGLYRSPAYFSPNGDAVQDTVSLHLTILEPVNLTVTIYDESDALIKTIERSYSDIGSEQVITWDGRDDYGFKAADGVYTIKIQNYEFFVNLDTEFPEVEDFTNNWITALSSSAYPIMGLDEAVEVVVSDLSSVPEASLEYRRFTDSDWQVLDSKLVEVNNELILQGGRDITSWIVGEYRVKATDPAGNKTIHFLPNELKINQAAILSVATESESDVELNQPVIYRSSDLQYEAPLSFQSSKEYTVDENSSIIFGLAESVVNKISTVEVLYAPVDDLSSFESAPIATMGTLEPCVIDIRVSCYTANSDVFVDNHGDQGEAYISWDLSAQHFDKSKTYRAYIRITDVFNKQVVTNSLLVTFDNFSINVSDEIDITDFGDGVFPYAKVLVGPFSDAGYQNLNLFVQSDQDLRFAERTLYKSVNPSNENAAHQEPQSRFYFNIGSLLSCKRYSLQAELQGADGSVYFSDIQILKSPCLELAFDARPVIPASCDEPATQLVKLSLIASSTESDGDNATLVELKEFSIYRDTVDGVDTIFNTLTPQYATPYEYQLDVTQFPEGELNLKAKAETVNGDVVITNFVVPIVHTEPSFDITYPIQGQEYCAVQYRKVTPPPESKEVYVNGLEIQGASESTGGSTYLLYTNGGFGYCQPLFYSEITWNNFPQPEPGSAEVRDDCEDLSKYYDPSESLVSKAPLIYNEASFSSKAKGTLGILEFTGASESEIEIQQLNWAGARVCTTITVEVDAEVEGLDITWSTSGAVSSRGFKAPVPVYSPNGDGIFDSIGWVFNISESVELGIDIYSVELNLSSAAPKGFTVSNEQLVDSIADSLSVASGSAEFTWDATAHPDGFYKVVFLTKDGCGLTETFEFYLEIDVTAPVAEINYPLDTDSLGVIVEPEGSISDIQRFSYTLSIGKGERTNQLITKTGMRSFSNEMLGLWNTYGLDGSWDITLNVTDFVGNNSEVVKTVVLPERIPVISILEPVNEFVSPNDDSNLDLAVFRVAFDSEALVTAEVFFNGAVVDTIFVDKTFSLGVHNIIWDAKNSDGIAFPDGVYKLRVAAHEATAGASEQVEYASVVLDMVQPQIVVTGLNQNIVGVSSNSDATTIFGEIIEEHFVGFEMLLIDSPKSTGKVMLSGGDNQPNSYFGEIPAANLGDDGVYGLRIHASDKAGNRSIFDFDLVLDTIAPVIDVQAPVAGEVFTSDQGLLVVSGSLVEENLVDYLVTLSSISHPESPVYSNTFFVLPEGPLAQLDLGAVDEGNYQLTITATDIGGQTARSSIPIVIDNTPPVVELSTPQNDSYLDSDIVGTVSDLTLLQYEISLAPGKLQEESLFSVLKIDGVSVTNRLLYNWPQLPEDGEYTIRLVALDAAENTTTLFSSFTIDTTPPEPPEMTSVELDSDSGVVTIVWEASSSSDVAGYEVYRNGSKISIALVGGLKFDDVGVLEGDYEYAVAAVDKAGLESSRNALLLNVDTTAPDVLVVRPGNGEVVSGLASLIGTANSLSGFLEYRVYVGPNADALTEIKKSSVTVIGDELAQINFSLLNEGGDYLIRLEAEDTAQNIAFLDVFVTVDNLAPAPPSGLSAVASGSDIQLTWDPSTEEDLRGYLLLRNDKLLGSPEVFIGNIADLAFSETVYADLNVVDGNYSYSVIAVDVAGNLSEPSPPFLLSLDLSVPHAEIVGISDGHEFENNVFLAVAVSDEDIVSVSIEYRSSTDSAWIPILNDYSEPYGVQWDTSAIPYGVYEARAVATDANAHVDDSPAIVTLNKVDLTQPAPVELLNLNVAGGNVALSWEASVEDDLAGYRIYKKSRGTDSNGWDTVNEDLVSETSLTFVVDDGSYDFVVAVVDTSANISSLSNERIGTVYTPSLAKPFTPTVDSDVTFNGATIPFASLELKATFESSSQLLSTIADENGGFSFVLDAIPKGRTYYSLTAMEDHGFLSRELSGSVLHAVAPSKVKNVLAQLSDDETATNVSWQENPESNVVGYNVYRNGESITARVSESNLGFVGSVNNGEEVSVIALTDSSTTNYWRMSEGNLPVLDITLAESRLVSEVGFEWTNSNLSASYIEIFAWDEGGEQYVLLQGQTLQAAAGQSVVFEKGYYTDKLQVRFIKSNAGSDMFLKKVDIISVDLLNAGDVFSDVPGDGLHGYQVSAFNRDAIEGEPSDIHNIAYGDVVGPAAVVLSVDVLDAAAQLSWAASGSVDVDLYRIYRDSVLIAELSASSGLAYTDEHLINGTYIYTAVPVDAAGNVGESSNEVAALISLPLLPAPINVSLTLSSLGSLSLSWKPGPDSLPYAYIIYRRVADESEFVQIAESSETRFLDAAVTYGELHGYVVRAVDAFGNLSAESQEIAAVAQDNFPPERPEIYFPTGSGMSTATVDSTTGIYGFSEPGSFVYLNENGRLKNLAQTRDELVVEYTGSRFLGSSVSVSEDGKIAVVGYNDYYEQKLYIYNGNRWEVSTETLTGVSGWDVVIYWVGNKVLVGANLSSEALLFDLNGKLVDRYSFVLANEYVGNLYFYDKVSADMYFAGFDSVSGSGGAYAYNFETAETRFVGEIQGDASISPNGKYISQIRNSGDDFRTLTLLEIETGLKVDYQIAGASAYYTSEAVSWSQDNRRILLSNGDTRSGYTEVGLFDIQTENYQTIIADSTRHLLNPAWSPDESSIAYTTYGDGRPAELIVYSLDDRTQNIVNAPVSTAPISPPVWNTRYVISAAQGNDAFAVRLPGVFVFDDVNLIEGENIFSVYAEDSSGNESEFSEVVSVVRNVSGLSDIVANIETQPLLPSAGALTTVTVNIANIGLATSGASDFNLRAYSPENDETDMLASLVGFPRLLPGQSTSFSFEWMPSTSGTYQLISSVDVGARVDESDEVNNSKASELTVVDEASPILKLSLKPAIRGDFGFKSEEAFSGDATMINAGGLFSGEVRITVVDENGYLVEDLGKTVLENISHGMTTRVPFSWNTGATFEGNYRVEAVLVDSSQTKLDSALQDFNIIEDLRVVASLTTQLPSYSANEAVRISGIILNESSSSVFNGGTATVEISDSANVPIYSHQIVVGQILPRAKGELFIDWNTATSLPGNYSVKLLVEASQDIGSVNSSAIFDVRMSAPQLTGGFSLDSFEVGRGEDISVDYILSNLGNSQLEDLELKLTVVDLQDQNILMSVQDTNLLGYLAREQRTQLLHAGSNSIGDYKIILEYTALVNGVSYEGVIDRSDFSIQDVLAPAVEYESPEIGEIINTNLSPILLRATDVDSVVESVQLTVNGGNSFLNTIRDVQDVDRYQAILGPVGDGALDVSAIAIDRAGNQSNPVSLSLVVDNTAPQIEVTGVDDGEFYSGTVFPEVVVTDAHFESSEIKLNGADFTSGTAVTEDNNYQLAVSATDSAGNTSTRIFLFTIDSIEALIEISGVSDNGTFGQTVVPVINIVDDNLASSSITLNGVDFESGMAVTLEGDYVLTVVAEDSAGRVSERTISFELDFTSPQIPSISSPENGSNLTESRVELIGSAEPGSLVLIEINNAQIENATADSGGSFVVSNVSLETGSNNFVVTAQDKAGNISETLVYNLTLGQVQSVGLDQGVAKKPRVLIWAPSKHLYYHPSCFGGSHSGHVNNYEHYHHDAEALLEFYEDVYTASDIDFITVRDPWTFLSELRTQQYTVVNLVNLDSNFAMPFMFMGGAAIELRAAVLAGTGLVLNTNRPYSMRGMREVFGATIRGRMGHTPNVGFNGLLPSNVSNEVLNGDGLVVELNGGMPRGLMSYSCNHGNNTECQQAAIITNSYGLGNTALIPFNLLDLEESAARELVSNITGAVHPLDMKPLAATLIPLDVSLSNLVVGESYAVEQSLSDRLSFVEIFYGGAANDDGAHWSFDNIESERAKVGSLVLINESDGNYDISTSIYHDIVSQSNLIAENVVSIEVDKSLVDMEAELLSRIQGLPSFGFYSFQYSHTLKLATLSITSPKRNAWETSYAIFSLSLVIDNLTHFYQEDDVAILASQLLTAYQSKWRTQL